MIGTSLHAPKIFSQWVLSSLKKQNRLIHVSANMASKGLMVGLKSGKKRYNIKQLRIDGESGDVKGPTVDSRNERLPEVVAGYSRDDIWNMDETGLFWRVLPDRGVGTKGKDTRE